MPTISVSIDPDVEVRVKAFSKGIGVSLDTLVSRALVFALRSRYPSNELPGAPDYPDQGLPGGGGSTKPVEPDEGHPDQGLPGRGGISRPGGGGSTKPVDPDEGAPDQGLPEGGLVPDNSLPGRGLCPVFNPKVDNKLPTVEVPIDPGYGVDAGGVAQPKK